MKKICTLCCAALLFMVAGCSDAKTKLSNGSDALVTVGKTTITKESIYNGLKANGSVTEIVAQITKYICDQEIPVTDEIIAKAKETMAQFKTYIGDEKWESFIGEMGYESEQEYFDDRVILAARSGEIVGNYMENEFEAIKKKYQPVEVEVFETTDEEVAKEVLEKVKKGELTIKEAVEQYDGVTKSFSGDPQVITNQGPLPSNVMTNIATVTEDNTVLNTFQFKVDLSAYYVVKVTKVDVDKEAAIKAISSIGEVSDEAFAFYLDKYNFTVYDIDVFTAFEAQSPNYLVQNKK